MTTVGVLVHVYWLGTPNPNAFLMHTVKSAQSRKIATELLMATIQAYTTVQQTTSNKDL